MLPYKNIPQNRMQQNVIKMILSGSSTKYLIINEKMKNILPLFSSQAFLESKQLEKSSLFIEWEHSPTKSTASCKKVLLLFIKG